MFSRIRFQRRDEAYLRRDEVLSKHICLRVRVNLSNELLLLLSENSFSGNLESQKCRSIFVTELFLSLKVFSAGCVCEIFLTNHGEIKS